MGEPRQSDQETQDLTELTAVHPPFPHRQSVACGPTCAYHPEMERQLGAGGAIMRATHEDVVYIRGRIDLLADRLPAMDRRIGRLEGLYRKPIVTASVVSGLIIAVVELIKAFAPHLR